MANALITQLNNPAVLQTANQRLATAASLLLTVACAYLLVEITWMFFPQEKAALLPARSQKQVVINKQAQQNNFNALTAANIFGVMDTGAVQQPTEVPETKLNLTLKGVLAASTELASAIIGQGPTGAEDIYSVGDRLPGGVLIKEIHPEYVVLDRNGRLETLKLQKESGIDEINAAISQSSSETDSDAALSPAGALREIRGNILKNPTSFGEYALPVVVKENGKQIGYRLQPQQKGALLSELGLQSTDVIIEINGVKLDDPQNGISALRKLSTATNVNIVVKRDGAEVPLNISLQ
jgi:general secretion pathway protein C